MDNWRGLVEAQGNPLIEGRQASFFWFGDWAPRLIGDFCDWESGSPAELGEVEPGVWAVELEFEPDAYMEYAFSDGENRVADPYNPRTTPDGFGHANHYFYMLEGGPTPLARSPRGFPKGTVSRHELPCDYFLTGKTRAVWLYQPPTGEPCPLWVVWDGRDYLTRAALVNIVENLSAAGRIPPLALAMLQNGGEKRSIEYMCSDMTIGFVMERLLPFARERLNLLDLGENPGAYGVMGASLGGLMALYTGLRAPEVFGKVLAQSGAFDFPHQRPVTYDLVAYGPPQPIKVWMDAGRYEWLLEPNRMMHALLQERGYPVEYREYPGGHNYPSWRDDLWRGLEWLYS